MCHLAYKKYNHLDEKKQYIYLYGWRNGLPGRYANVELRATV